MALGIALAVISEIVGDELLEEIFDESGIPIGLAGAATDTLLGSFRGDQAVQDLGAEAGIAGADPATAGGVQSTLASPDPVVSRKGAGNIVKDAVGPNSRAGTARNRPRPAAAPNAAERSASVQETLARATSPGATTPSEVTTRLQDFAANPSSSLGLGQDEVTESLNLRQTDPARGGDLSFRRDLTAGDLEQGIISPREPGAAARLAQGALRSPKATFAREVSGALGANEPVQQFLSGAASGSATEFLRGAEALAENVPALGPALTGARILAELESGNFVPKDPKEGEGDDPVLGPIARAAVIFSDIVRIAKSGGTPAIVGLEDRLTGQRLSNQLQQARLVQAESDAYGDSVLRIRSAIAGNPGQRDAAVTAELERIEDGFGEDAADRLRTQLEISPHLLEFSEARSATQRHPEIARAALAGDSERVSELMSDPRVRAEISAQVIRENVGRFNEEYGRALEFLNSTTDPELAKDFERMSRSEGGLDIAEIISLNSRLPEEARVSDFAIEFSSRSPAYLQTLGIFTDEESIQRRIAELPLIERRTDRGATIITDALGGNKTVVQPGQTFVIPNDDAAVNALARAGFNQVTRGEKLLSLDDGQSVIAPDGTPFNVNDAAGSFGFEGERSTIVSGTLIGAKDLTDFKQAKLASRNALSLTSTIVRSIETNGDAFEAGGNFAGFLSQLGSDVSSSIQLGLDAIGSDRSKKAESDFTDALTDEHVNSVVQSLAIDNAAARTLIKQLVFVSAGIFGQSGHAISNRDIEFITEMVASRDIDQLKRKVQLLHNTVIDQFENRAETEREALLARGQRLEPGSGLFTIPGRRFEFEGVGAPTGARVRDPGAVEPRGAAEPGGDILERAAADAGTSRDRLAKVVAKANELREADPKLSAGDAMKQAFVEIPEE